ncbi:MAG: lyase family protein [Planctomycetota bacterium]
MNREFQNTISPLDSRYRSLAPEYYETISDYLSEAANMMYYGRVEAALATALSDFGVAPQDFGERVSAIVEALPFSEVYEEERRIQHNIRALVNCIQRLLPEKHRPYVHLFATSSDIIDTARAVQYRAFANSVLLPKFLDCTDLLYDLAKRHSNLPQVGRTHGRHAEPTTLGYWAAWHASRLEGRLHALHASFGNLVGKLSGAVGTRAAISLAIEDPGAFEVAVLCKLGLNPGRNELSTQIVQPEPLVDCLHAVTSSFGVLASIADDFRHLMRSEISEIEEADVPDRVGSSTMPHKINPKDFENVKSFWKTYMPRMTTCYMDQISEHQRDLTNSASQRFTNELLAGFAFATDRLSVAIRGTVINEGALRSNLQEGVSDVASEPLYIALALKGVPRAHETVRQLAKMARETGTSIFTLARQDRSLAPMIRDLPERIADTLDRPGGYLGDAPQKARAAADGWIKRREEWRSIGCGHNPKG